MMLLNQKKLKLANEDDQEKNHMLVFILSWANFPLLYFVCLGQNFVVINKMSEASFLSLAKQNRLSQVTFDFMDFWDLQ